MEQILIVEDDLRLNQGLCKALKSENRKIISCMDLKKRKRTTRNWRCIIDIIGYKFARWKWIRLYKRIKRR